MESPTGIENKRDLRSKEVDSAAASRKQAESEKRNVGNGTIETVVSIGPEEIWELG